ncbi:MAG: hypothetical protein PHS40_05570 [Mariniphaga sp.]|nr:hypothetical protein [Mariniphaga sp.]
MNTSSIEIYKLEEGRTEISVMLDGETVWLSLNQMKDLFQRDKSVISRHINNIYKEGELKKETTIANFATVQIEGSRKITRNIEYFNLDVILFHFTNCLIDLVYGIHHPHHAINRLKLVTNSHRHIHVLNIIFFNTFKILFNLLFLFVNIVYIIEVTDVTIFIN